MLYRIYCYNVKASCIWWGKIHEFHPQEQGNFWHPLVLEKIYIYNRIQTWYETAFGDSNAGEISRKLTYILATGESFKNIHSFGLSFVYPKCTAPQVMKETPLIGQTYWESYSIIQQISPNSHWWFLADFLPISHMIWEMLWFFRSYNSRWSRFSPPLWFLADFSARNRQCELGITWKWDLCV